MSVGRLLRSIYLLYFSQPAAERALYRAVSARPIRSIVELGLGPALRTRRLLEIASWRPTYQPLRYTAIDLFEARPAGQPPLPLKQAFTTLQSPQVRVQLVPGAADVALRRVANSLTNTDLLLISANQDPQTLAAAWAWMPRMLTPTSLVYQEVRASQGAQTSWQPLALAEIQQLAAQTAKHARRAA